jgi:spoIIIJ-associated protein
MQQSEVISMITTLLDRLGVSYDSVVFDDSPPHALFSISSPESALLIGIQGANLDALNHLIRRFVEQRFGEEDARLVSVDVNGFRKRKIEDIQNKARMVAERVRLFKSNVELSPMSAYERMIIHALFAEDPDVMTVSEGEGKFRRIIIKPRLGEMSAS